VKPFSTYRVKPFYLSNRSTFQSQPAPLRGGRGGAKGGDVKAGAKKGDAKAGAKAGAKDGGGRPTDSNGRVVMVEPFKPGRKSKAHPRSGDRSSTFR
jgi:hypothetical protein